MTDHATPQDSAVTPQDGAASPADAPAPPPVAPPAAFAPPSPGAVTGQDAVGAPAADPWGVPVAPPVPEPLSPEELAARRTRRRRAAVRWSAAVLVCALAGTEAAVAVTTPDRTDIPGLATERDGRYTFPALVLPPLPSGKAVPRESKSRHAADLRYLLLPAPKEAGGSLAPVVFPSPTAPASASASSSASVGAAASPTAGATASGTPSSGAPTAAATTAATTDWVPCDALAGEQKDAAELRALLLQNACRAATVREWTATDGTRTQIRLLAFGGSTEAWDVFADLRSKGDPKGVPGLKTGPTQGWDSVNGVDLATRETPATGPDAGPTGRVAYLSAGDVVGVVTMTNPKGVKTAAFRQVVTLQSDLLA
ncbi:hypothetical protein [Streptomyces sp. CB01881]|uniref:hypothetical protein n=1 Tax=Streptomyces sp. CB01881 TaxID=2078691 RepID=UPI000CDC34D8|nr:hypothetical protein [Streptomyces sp. CB01881]AUY50596.1 hypothetical protein C2142_18460 [Streptomyces sp. CB01881]TYC73983.1 hypothetical protein EH183_18435 [Streptomyces sp. CB01881]